MMSSSLLSRISFSSTTAAPIRALSLPSTSLLSSSSSSSLFSSLSSSSLLSSSSSSSSASSSSSSSSSLSFLYPFFFRSFATLREYNNFRTVHPSLPSIPNTEIPVFTTKSNISEEDREKEKKIYSTYGKGKAAARKAETIYNNNRNKAKKLGLKTPEILMNEIITEEKKKKKQSKRRLGRNPPYGTQAKIVYDYIIKNQPVFRKHLQEIFVGKKYSEEDPKIKELLINLNQYRRCSIDELTIKTNNDFNRVLKLLIKQKLIYGKPPSSPMVQALFDQYEKNNQKPPITKHEDIKQWYIIGRDYSKEKQLEQDHMNEKLEKDKQEKQAWMEDKKKRTEANKIKRMAEKELRKHHSEADIIRKQEKKQENKEKLFELKGIPKRKPGEARLSLEELKIKYASIIEENQKNLLKKKNNRKEKKIQQGEKIEKEQTIETEKVL